MRNVKRILGVIIALSVVVLALGACSNGKSADKKMYNIGVTKFADHPSLDNCYNGFIEGLKEEGFTEGENISIDMQSAKADTAVASQIAQNFANSKKDLVCGIATVSAQTLYSACYDKGIPVIFNAISDPVAAKLAKSKTEPMDNITGVSDQLPVEDQLKLIRKILPDAKKIGILYTTSEANSISSLETYKELAKNYGFEIVDKGIGTQAEIPQAADIILQQVDCITNLTDNTVVASLSIILEKANAKGIPVFGSEEEQVANGCIACAGLNYYNLGIQAGKMAARVLKGEDISKMPYETLKESSITVNSNVAKSLGITIPDDVLDMAEEAK